MKREHSTSNDCSSKFLIAFGLQRIERNQVISSPHSHYPGRAICINHTKGSHPTSLLCKLRLHWCIWWNLLTTFQERGVWEIHGRRYLRSTWGLEECRRKNYLTLYRAHSVTWLIIFSQNPGSVSWHLLRLYQNRDSDSVLFIFIAAQTFSSHQCTIAFLLYTFPPVKLLISIWHFCSLLASENLNLSSHYWKLLWFFTLATARWFWTPPSLNTSIGPRLNFFLCPVDRSECN